VHSRYLIARWSAPARLRLYGHRIFPIRIRRPETDHTPGLQPFLRTICASSARIIIQFGRLPPTTSSFRICGNLPCSSQAMKKGPQSIKGRSPPDHIRQYLGPGKRRRHRFERNPSRSSPYCPALPRTDRYCLTVFLLAKSSFSFADILFDRPKEIRLLFRTQQRPHHRHAPGGIQHMHDARSNSGAIFTAVCIREVVAPPISSGTSKSCLFISFATCTISSSEGVISPLRPMTSTFSLLAVSSILSSAP
jgi:hypothetical protein